MALYCMHVHFIQLIGKCVFFVRYVMTSKVNTWVYIIDTWHINEVDFVTTLFLIYFISTIVIIYYDEVFMSKQRCSIFTYFESILNIFSPCFHFLMDWLFACGWLFFIIELYLLDAHLKNCNPSDYFME